MSDRTGKTAAMGSPRHSCLRLDLIGDDPKSKDVIFVKGTWHPSHFDLAITDGLRCWACQASREEVAQRAEQWDQPVDDYIAMVEQYLGFQQPGSIYKFEDAGNGQRRLSFTFDKEGIKLEWRWKCLPSTNDKQMAVGILDFLMDANTRLSEEVVRKSDAFDRLKIEAEKCLEQSERLAKEKTDFEYAVYSKFVAVLNSKKAKLKELRDRLSKLESSTVKRVEEEEDGSTDQTESFDEQSDNEISVDAVSDLPGTSKNTRGSTVTKRKRKAV